MTTPHNAVYAVARALMAAIFLVAGVRKLVGYAGTLGYFGASREGLSGWSASE